MSTNDFTDGYKKKIDNLVDGIKGDSAYQVAVENGFEGTEEEWLASLKGEKGDIGNCIDRIEKTNSVGLIDTYTIYFTDGNTTTFTITNGKNGIDGVNGTNGENGKSLQFNWNGTQLGIKTENNTEYTYADLKGDKGDTGEQGEPGLKGDTGEGVPVGGTIGQLLAKKSNADNDTEWKTIDIDSINTRITDIEETLIQITKPIVQINGDNPQNIDINTEYVELGAEITNNGGQMSLEIDTSNVNTTTNGSYIVYYKATNNITGVEITKTRDVKVGTPSQFNLQDETGVKSIMTEKGIAFTDYKHGFAISNNSINGNEKMVSALLKNLTTNEEHIYTITEYSDSWGTEYYIPEEDGNYLLVSTDINGYISTFDFIIDTKAPVVTGVRAGRYLTAVTITFEDVNDVATATLTNTTTTEVIDIKAWLVENNTNQYTITENATYKLDASDKYGNKIATINFKVQISE